MTLSSGLTPDQDPKHGENLTDTDPLNSGKVNSSDPSKAPEVAPKPDTDLSAAQMPVVQGVGPAVEDPTVLEGNGRLDSRQPLKQIRHPYSPLTAFDQLVSVANAQVYQPKDNGELMRSPGGVATGLQQALAPFGDSATAICIQPASIKNGTLTISDFKKGVDEGRFTKPPLNLDSVSLGAKTFQGYYESVANGTLWPVMHSLPERSQPIAPGDWNDYVAVNRKLADLTLEHARSPKSLVWIHDYQLTLVCDMVREKKPDQAIGYFHHIPFPEPRVLNNGLGKQAEEVLKGMMGADYVAFQTPRDASNFVRCLQDSDRYANVQIEKNPFPDNPSITHQIFLKDRSLCIGVNPISVDFGAVRNITETQQAEDAEVAVKQRYKQRDIPLIISVDRLDYTKGIPQRMEAIEKLLDTNPDLIGKFTYLQSAAASGRNAAPAYTKFADEVKAIADRINAKFGTADWKPINYIVQSLTPLEVMGYIRAADIVATTPVADGHNLFCKEAIAASSNSGAMQLILGSGAGAALQLSEHSIMVDGAKAEDVALGMKRAINRYLSKDNEGIVRDWIGLMGTCMDHTVGAWRDSFLINAKMSLSSVYH